MGSVTQHQPEQEQQGGQEERKAQTKGQGPPGEGVRGQLGTGQRPAQEGHGLHGGLGHVQIAQELAPPGHDPSHFLESEGEDDGQASVGFQQAAQGRRPEQQLQAQEHGIGVGQKDLGGQGIAQEPVAGGEYRKNGELTEEHAMGEGHGHAQAQALEAFGAPPGSEPVAQGEDAAQEDHRGHHHEQGTAQDVHGPGLGVVGDETHRQAVAEDHDLAAVPPEALHPAQHQAGEQEAHAGPYDPQL